MAAWTDVQVWSWHESWVSHCHQLLWNTWTEKKSPPNRKSLSVQRFLYFFLKIILICMYWSLSFFPIISTVKYTYVLNTDKPLFWFYLPTYTFIPIYTYIYLYTYLYANNSNLYNFFKLFQGLLPQCSFFEIKDLICNIVFF